MKMITKTLWLLPFLAIATTSSSYAADKPFVWPKGAKAAVNLAYDDAVFSQLDNAIPTLDKYNIKGSFYLTLNHDSISKRMNDWRKAAANGHELGNHTLFHQCSRNSPDREWVPLEHDLDKITAKQLAAQIRIANTMLYAIDGKTERTFTTPCGDLKAGGEYYIPLIKNDFVAIKSYFGGITPDMNTLDPYAVGVETPFNVTGQHLIAQVKEAAKRGTMINFTFHGIGGDHMSTSREAHEELVKYLADHKDIYWTDTFINIMKYVKAQHSDQQQTSSSM